MLEMSSFLKKEQEHFEGERYPVSHLFMIIVQMLLCR